MAYVDIIWNDQKGNYLCAQCIRSFFFRFRAWITFGWDCEHFETKVFNRKPHKPIDIPGWLWALQTIMFAQYQIVWHLTAKCNHIERTTQLCGWIAQIQCKMTNEKKNKNNQYHNGKLIWNRKKLKENHTKDEKKKLNQKTTKNCRGKTL